MFNKKTAGNSAFIWLAWLDEYLKLCGQTAKYSQYYDAAIQNDALQAKEIYDRYGEGSLPKMVGLLDTFTREAVRRMEGAGCNVIIHLASGLPRQLSDNPDTYVLHVDVDNRLESTAAAMIKELREQGFPNNFFICANMWNLSQIALWFKKFTKGKNLDQQRIGIIMPSVLDFMGDWAIPVQLQALRDNVPAGTLLAISATCHNLPGTTERPVEATTLVNENQGFTRGKGDHLFIRSKDNLEEIVRAGRWRMPNTNIMPFTNLEDLPEAPEIPAFRLMGTFFAGMIIQKA